MAKKHTKKSGGEVYTPFNIVDMMLDFSEYNNAKNIQKKHVIDNSCGDGRFLQKIVKRYIESYNNTNKERLRDELATYIHGIEINSNSVLKCKQNLNAILDSFGIEHIEWDIRCKNSLTEHDYDGKMDYVFGNPPYVRNCNIGENRNEENDDYQIFRKYSFTQKGLPDLCLAFYELGLTMRNENGILCYIAPSTWTTSDSGVFMRQFIEESKNLSKIIDFEHIQLFEDAQTYVMITLFNKNKNSKVDYYKYNKETEKEYFISSITYEKFFINNKVYITDDIGLDLIKKVENSYKGKVQVKNGYATLADNIFIDGLPESDIYTIPVIKGSTGKKTRCLFPYDENLNIIDLSVIQEKSKTIYDYIKSNEDGLRDRAYEKRGDPNSWYAIGRSQGIIDTFKDKISLNNVIRKKEDIRLEKVPKGTGIYSGLYILTDVPYEKIKEIVVSDDFIKYVKSLRKYKSGDYYTFSTKEVQKYINYKLENHD